MSDRDILLPVVPQTYGEAVALYGKSLIYCEPHEWDNRTTAENAAWLIKILSADRGSLWDSLKENQDVISDVIREGRPLTAEGAIEIFKEMYCEMNKALDPEWECDPIE